MAGKAFSIAGIRHEASHDNYLKINALSNSRVASSHSKQSQSVAEDGLPTIRHDQSMYYETEEGPHANEDAEEEHDLLSAPRGLNTNKLSAVVSRSSQGQA